MTKLFIRARPLFVILLGIYFMPGCELQNPTGVPFSVTSKNQTMAHTPIPTITPTPTLTPLPTPTFQPVRSGTPLPQSSALIQPETIDRLTKLAHWEANSSVVKILFSPDGELLAAYSRAAYGSGQEMQIWRVQTGQELNSFDVPIIANNHFSFTPPGEQFIFVASSENSSGDDQWSPLSGKLVTWSVPDGKLVSSWGSKLTWFFLYESGEFIRTVAQADTFDTFRSVRRYHGLVNTYEFPSMAEVDSYEISSSEVGPLLLEPHPNFEDWGPVDFGGKVKRRTFSSDGNVMAALLDDNTIEVWDIQDGVLLSKCTNQQVSTYDFQDITLSPDGSILATLGKTEATLGIWRVSDGELLLLKTVAKESTSNGGVSLVSRRNLVRSIGPYFWLTFSPDGRYLAVAQTDFVQVWGVP